MSINVYFTTDEAVRNLPDFASTKRRAGRRGEEQEWEEYSVAGLKLSRDDKGRWYIILHQPTELIPEAVKDIVAEITFYEHFENSAPRERGIYSYGTAEAEVDNSRYEKSHYGVHIKSRTMEDLLTLYRKIRAGAIRPDESWESVQAGLSAADMYALFQRLRRENETLHLRLEALQDRLYDADDMRVDDELSDENRES
jgi:hypothetical protein